MTSSGDGIVPRVNSNETLKVLYCYTQGIAVSLITFFSMQRLRQCAVCSLQLFRSPLQLRDPEDSQPYIWSGNLLTDFV